MRKKNYAFSLVLTIALCLHAWAQGSDTAPQQSSSGQSPQQQSSADQQMPRMQMPESQGQHSSQSDMQAMEHEKISGTPMNMNQQPTIFVEEITRHGTSGTSAEPNSTPTPMLMTMKGKWMLMFHGEAFLNLIQQSGPRGTDKVFSTNWFMPMAQHPLGPGTFTTRVMLSLEPGTIHSQPPPARHPTDTILPQKPPAGTRRFRLAL